MTVLALSQIFKSVVNAKNSIEFVFEFLGVQARVVLLSSFAYSRLQQCATVAS